MELGLDVGPAQGLGLMAKGGEQPPVTVVLGLCGAHPWLGVSAPVWSTSMPFSGVGDSSKALSGEGEAV